MMLIPGGFCRHATPHPQPKPADRLDGTRVSASFSPVSLSQAPTTLVKYSHTLTLGL